MTNSEKNIYIIFTIIIIDFAFVFSFRKEVNNWLTSIKNCYKCFSFFPCSIFCKTVINYSVICIWQTSSGCIIKAYRRSMKGANAQISTTRNIGSADSLGRSPWPNLALSPWKSFCSESLSFETDCLRFEWQKPGCEHAACYMHTPDHGSLTAFFNRRIILE